MIDRIDQTIQDAEQTERTAFYAKQKAYEKLKDSLESKYSDKLDKIDRIQNDR